MQQIIRFSAMLVIAVFVSSAAASAQTKPLRHIVYDFSVGFQTRNIMANTSGDGNSEQAANDSDKGEIVVDISGVEPDGGLVLTVAEKALDNKRNSGASTCVVYANTNVVCSGSPNPEELSVVRTLSPKFFDPSNLDANHHWQVSNPSAGVQIDFTANVAAGSTTVAITAERNEKAPGGNSSHSEGKYSYDMVKLLPTTISEYQTVRQQAGTSYSTIIIDMSATLATDSGIAKN